MHLIQEIRITFHLAKSYFDDDGSQIYLIFQSVFKYFKLVNGTIDKIFGWTGLAEESLTTPPSFDNSFALTFIIPKQQ